MAKDVRSTILTEHRKVSASRRILALINFIAVFVGTLVTLFFVSKRGAPDEIFVHLYVLLAINVIQIALCVTDYVSHNVFGTYFKYLPIVSYAVGGLWVAVTISELVFGTLALGVLRNDLLGVAIIQFVTCLVAYLVWPMMDRQAIDTMIKPSVRGDEALRAKKANGYVLRYVLVCLMIVATQAGALLVYKVPPRLYDLFAESRALKYELSDEADEYIVTKVYSGTSTLVNIPATYNNKPVVGIAKGALVEDDLVDEYKVTQIVFGTPVAGENGEIVYESNLKYIDEGSIANDHIEELVIPESVIRIGDGAIRSSSLKQMHYGARADFSISYLECESLEKIVMEGENVGNIVSLVGMSETTKIQISKDIYNQYREANFDYVGSFTPILDKDEYYIDFFTNCDYYIETIFAKLGEDVSLSYQDLRNSELSGASLVTDTLAYIKNPRELGTNGAKADSAFRGWYFDSDFTQECEFLETESRVFTNTTALYAKWEDEYTGTLDWGTHKPADSASAIYWTDNDVVEFPVVEDRTGYSEGVRWTVDEGKIATSNSQNISKSVTLHAEWILDKPTIDIVSEMDDPDELKLSYDKNTVSFTYDERNALTMSADYSHPLKNVTHQGRSASWEFAWRKVGDDEFGGTDSAVSLHNVAEAGEYELEVTITSAWLEKAVEKTGIKVRIDRKDIQLGTFKFDNKETTYNTSKQGISYEGKLGSDNIKESYAYYDETTGELVSCEKNGVKDAGVYRVELTLEKNNQAEAANYNTTTVTATYTILPKQLNYLGWSGLGGAFDENVTTYDGNEKQYRVNLSGQLPGDTVELEYKGGAAMNSGDYTVEVLGVKNSNYTLEGILKENLYRNWKINKREVTVSAWRVDGDGWASNSIVYDGTQHSVYAVLDGGVAKDNVKFVYSPDADFSNAGTNAANYIAKIVGVDDDNYYFNVNASNAQFAWSIEPRVLHVSYPTLNYTYKAQEQTLTATISNFMDEDLEKFTLECFDRTGTSASLDVAWGGINKTQNKLTIDFSATNAADYTACLNGLNVTKGEFLNNYSLDATSKSFTIAPKQLKVQKANNEHVYTGLDQELVVVVSDMFESDLAYFDMQQFTTTAPQGRINYSAGNFELVYSGKNAGSYDVSVSAFKYFNGNYVLVEEFTDTITIAKRGLTLSAWQITDLSPDGESQALTRSESFEYNYYGYKVSEATLEGVQNDETVDLTFAGDVQNQALVTGAYVTTATLDSEAYPNYVMNSTSISWYIAPKAVDFTWTIDGVDVTYTVGTSDWGDSRYYNGETRTIAPKFALLGDDTATVDATSKTNTPLDVKDVKESGYLYEITSISNSNYKLGEGVKFYFEIMKKELTLVWTDPTAEFVYNGQYQSPTFAIEGIEQSDLDAGTMTIEAWNQFNAKISFVADGGEYSFVGSEKGFAVDVASYSIKEIDVYKNGSVDGNYKLVFETKDAYSFSIVPKTLDLTGVWTYENSARGTGEYQGFTELVYNAQEYTLTTSFDQSQLVKRLEADAADEVTLEYDSTTNVNVREYETNVIGLLGAGAANYTLNLTEEGGEPNDEKATLSWEIHKKRLALSWSVDENRTYTSYEQSQAATVQYGATGDDDGLAYHGDSVEVYYDTNSATNAGTYTAIVSGLDNGNYYLDESTTSQEWTIKPYAISLSWSQGYFTYNAQPQSPTASWYVHGKTVHAATYENTDNVNVGTYTVTAYGTDDSNYVLETTEATSSYEYYIQAKEITLQWAVNGAEAQSYYTYDGNEYEVIPTAVGVREGDGVNLTYEDNKFKNVGSYTVRVTGIDNTNYYLSESKNYKTITVNPKYLTFNWTWDGDTTEKTFVYDSEYHTLVATPVGVVDGDTVNINYTQTNSSVKDVGTYTVQVSSFDNENYAFSTSNVNDYKKSITIEAQKVRIVWTGLEQFTYDGIERSTSLNVYGANDGKLIYTNAAAITAKSATTHSYTLTQSTMKSYDANNNNYTLVNPAEGAVTRKVVVDKKVVTLAWSGLENVYDGVAHYASATVTNLCDGDTTTISYRSSRLSSYGSIGSSSNYATSAGEYTVSVYSLGNSNYTISGAENVSTTLKIAKQKVSISWSETKTFEYDGTFRSFGATIVGATDGNNVAFSYSGTTGSRKNVGTYVLTVGTITNENYTLENYEGDISSTYYITPITLDVAWTEELEYTYDGSSKTIYWWATNSLSGDGTVYLQCEYEVLSDKGALVYGGGNQIQATKAGRYQITLTGVSNNQSGNYVLPEDASQIVRTFEIAPQKVTIDWNGTTGEKTYSAATTWSMSATASGTVQGSAISIATVLNIATTEQKYKDVGTYSVNVIGLAEAYADNYTLEGIEDLSGTITIVPQTVAITWGNLETVYNGYAQIPNVSIMGANDGRSVGFNVLTGGKSLVNVGSYAVSVELTDANYTLEGVSGASATYVINSQAVSVTWGETSFVYNGKDQRPTVTVVGASDKLSVPYSISAAQMNVGTYVAQITLTSANYTLEDNENASVEYEIAKQKVVVAWGETSFVYNGEAQRPMVTVVGADDGLAVDFSQAEGQITPGDYKATIILADSNYEFTDESDSTMTYSIAKKEVSIVWNVPDGQRADGTAKTVTATAQGMVNGESFELVIEIKDSTGATVSTVTEAGTYTATVTSTWGFTALYSIEEATNKTVTFTVLEAEQAPEETDDPEEESVA